MPPVEDRLNTLATLEQWALACRKTPGFLEAHFLGSVLRDKDFHPASDVDLVVFARDASSRERFEPGLRKISAITGHSIDLTVFTRDQLENFSPLHRFSNLIFSLGSDVSPLIRTLPRSREWFSPSFVRFWYWHNTLRSLYVWLKDNPGQKPPEEFLRRNASYAKLVELRGRVTYGPQDSLDAFADLWESTEWKDHVTHAHWALEHLHRSARDVEHPDALVNAPHLKELRYSFVDQGAFFREMPLGDFCDLLSAHGKELHREILRKLGIL